MRHPAPAEAGEGGGGGGGGEEPPPPPRPSPRTAPVPAAPAPGGTPAPHPCPARPPRPAPATARARSGEGSHWARGGERTCRLPPLPAEGGARGGTRWPCLPSLPPPSGVTRGGGGARCLEDTGRGEAGHGARRLALCNRGGGGRGRAAPKAAEGCTLLSGRGHPAQAQRWSPPPPTRVLGARPPACGAPGPLSSFPWGRGWFAPVPAELGAPAGSARLGEGLGQHWSPLCRWQR